MALLTGADGAVLLGLDGVALNDGLPSSDFDYTTTILSQYANASVIRALLSAFADALDPATDIATFYANVWNIDTATGYGLDVWGRIVGVGRLLNVSSGTYFGFKEPNDSSETPFNQAPFWGGSGASTSNFSMSDFTYRNVIKAKAMANISAASIPAINAVLRAMFPNSAGAWVTDPANKTMTYTFNWHLSAVEQAIVTQTSVLPRPAGIAVSIVQM